MHARALGSTEGLPAANVLTVAKVRSTPRAVLVIEIFAVIGEKRHRPVTVHAIARVNRGSVGLRV